MFHRTNFTTASTTTSTTLLEGMGKEIIQNVSFSVKFAGEGSPANLYHDLEYKVAGKQQSYQVQPQK